MKHQTFHFEAEHKFTSCPHCQARDVVEEEKVVKRGAITVAFDPEIVRWRGKYVPLSRVEAKLFAVIAARGRMLNIEIDEALEGMGASAATRSLVLGHIRAKLRRIGACDPFERLGRDGICLRVDADERGSAGVVIGLKQPRYSKVASASDMIDHQQAAAQAFVTTQ